MKVILTEDIQKLGKKGSIVEVKDGYAKNFLIKNHKAVAYTSRSAEILSIQKNEQTKLEKQRLNHANALKTKLEKLNLIFYLKENHGKLFGSISHKQIEKEINKHNIDIQKKKIEPKGGLHSLGEHQLTIKLYPNVIAKMIVNVEGK